MNMEIFIITIASFATALLGFGFKYLGRFSGEIPGVKEGNLFINRKALRAAGIHLAIMAGIDGNPRTGATSIVLNGPH